MKNLIPILFFAAFVASCAANNSIDSEPSEALEIDLTQSENETQVESPLIVEFSSIDGLTISAAIYQIDETSPSILLCHQAGYNHHEYDEIAPKLNALGYNCISIDQRSGGVLNDFSNQTADRAISQSLPVQYIDAEQDIIAGIDFTHNYFNQRVILWGSSYSSALALHIGANNEKVKAVVSFSPGDYFGDARPLLKTTMLEMKRPYFITSSKDEAAAISDFLSGTKPEENQVQFIPKTTGNHGAKALWEEAPSQQEYWTALTEFLKKLKVK